ncbi:MAG: hypothetical protein KBG00_17785, partial [Rhodoferax sp.]|nr:hypothetical protein [Rhodoferax sp.]
RCIASTIGLANAWTIAPRMRSFITWKRQLLNYPLMHFVLESAAKKAYGASFLSACSYLF